MQLEGKIIIVTGAARGIGGAVAQAYVAEGAKVIAVDRPGAFAADSPLRNTDKALIVEEDLLDATAPKRIVQKAVDTFGGLTTLVNCAQAATQKLFNDTTDEDWNLAFGTGFWATERLMQNAYPYLRDSHGSVINFASGAGIIGQPTQAAYGANKEAIRGLTRVVAHEWAPDQIRVNVVGPFALSEGVKAYFDANPDRAKEAAASTPLGRVGDLKKDIAPVLVFLASDASQYITGQTIMVDGGQVQMY